MMKELSLRDHITILYEQEGIKASLIFKCHFMCAYYCFLDCLL